MTLMAERHKRGIYFYRELSDAAKTKAAAEGEKNGIDECELYYYTFTKQGDFTEDYIME